MTRKDELNTLNTRELASYRNICLMNTGMIQNADDRAQNENDLDIAEVLLEGRGVKLETGKLFDKGQLN